MGVTDINRNYTHRYGGQVHCIISRYEGHITFCNSDEGNQVCTKTPKKHSEGSMQSFQKFIHITQR